MPPRASGLRLLGWRIDQRSCYADDGQGVEAVLHNPASPRAKALHFGLTARVGCQQGGLRVGVWTRVGRGRLRRASATRWLSVAVSALSAGSCDVVTARERFPDWFTTMLIGKACVSQTLQKSRCGKSRDNSHWGAQPDTKPFLPYTVPRTWFAHSMQQVSHSHRRWSIQGAPIWGRATLPWHTLDEAP